MILSHVYYIDWHELTEFLFKTTKFLNKQIADCMRYFLTTGNIIRFMIYILPDFSTQI